MSIPLNNRLLYNRHLAFWLVGLLFVGAIIVLLSLTGALHLFKQKYEPSGSQFTKGEASQSNRSVPSSSKAQNLNSSSQVPDSSRKNTGNNGVVTLTVPTGDFVSSHHISLSASSQESSVCTTTPGSSCRIDFTKDGGTKSLQAETADSGGSAYWDWKPQDIGLSAGSWKVTAVASLNGQDKSTSDAMNLEVSP